MGTILTRPPGHRRDVVLRPAATARVYLGPGQAHETIAVPGVALGDGDVLVAIELSTVCAADVRAAHGQASAPVPLVPGHESVGRVIAVGDDGVRAADGAELRVGDRVVWSTSAACGDCAHCRRGMPQVCAALVLYGHRRIGGDGELSGAFASHVQLRPGTVIVRVPETLPAAVLAPASCATATAWAAVARAARHGALRGARLRVHGAGLIGLTAAAIAAEQGAVVDVRDPEDARRRRAPAFGATVFEGEPDVVVATTGGVASAVAEVAAGGIVVLVGGPHADVPPSADPEDDPACPGPLALDVADLAARLVTVAGVQRPGPDDLVEAVAFLAGRGRAYPFGEAVGAVHRLSALDEALAAASAPDAPPRTGLVPGP